MGKVIYAMSVSVDGFVEGGGGDLSWSYPSPELHRHFNELDRAVDIFLYGRRMYETMAAFWPTAGENPAAADFEIEYARIWKDKKKIVFSNSLTQVGWNSQLFRGDIAAEVNPLKAQPGKTFSVGGAALAASFMRLGLIDEYQLYVYPVVLGSGKPMFPQLSEHVNLRLVETRRFEEVVMMRYGKGN